jgi:hypothetical protein
VARVSVPGAGTMKLTVFFDPPFWVGLLEEERDGVLYAARHVFGTMPANQDIYTFVLRDLDGLRDRMTIGVPVDAAERARPKNPKRLQREIRREVEQQGITSKAHEAIRCELEQHKRERREQTHAQRDAVREHKRQVRRDKARQRHRGR